MLDTPEVRRVLEQLNRPTLVDIQPLIPILPIKTVSQLWEVLEVISKEWVRIHSYEGT